MPARAGSTTPTAVEASGTLIKPAPMPATRKPGMRCVQSAARLEAAHQQQRDADAAAKPGPIRKRVGTFSVSRPAIAAVMKIGPGEHEEAHADLDRRQAEPGLHVEHQVREQR